MKNLITTSVDGLIEEIDHIILKNRNSLSEKDLETLAKCKHELHELQKIRSHENLKLRNQVVQNVITLILEFFLS